MKNGTRVKTELGIGTIVGNEYIFNVPRFFVELDPGHTWSLKDSNAAFWKEELTILDEEPYQ